MYNNKAHTILGGVIASHGGQLLTSNAFCKVYLTGYLVDYPEEKQILIALKLKELPEVLLAYSNDEIPESSLFNAIRKITKTSHEGSDAIAWGIDAWAAAAGLSETDRQTIRQQCFPDASAEINIDRSLLDIAELPREVPSELPVVAPVSVAAERKSHLSFGAKLLATAAGVSGLIVFQVFGGNAPKPLKMPKLPMMIPDQATRAVEVEVVKPKPLVVSGKDAMPLAASVSAEESVKTTKPTPVSVAIPVPEKLQLVPNLTPRLLVSNPIPPIVSVKKTAYKVVQLDKSPKDKPELNTKALSLNVTSLKYKQKSQRLNADVESFLKYGN